MRGAVYLGGQDAFLAYARLTATGAVSLGGREADPLWAGCDHKQSVWVGGSSGPLRAGCGNLAVLTISLFGWAVSMRPSCVPLGTARRMWWSRAQDLDRSPVFYGG